MASVLCRSPSGRMHVAIRRSGSAALMKKRAQLYAEIADLTVSTDGRRVQTVAEEIHAQLRKLQAAQGA